MSIVIKCLGYISTLICDTCSENIEVSDDNIAPVPDGWSIISLKQIIVGQPKQSDEYKGYFCPECSSKSDIIKLAQASGEKAYALAQSNS